MNCGVALKNVSTYQPKSKIAAGLLAIFIGAFIVLGIEIWAIVEGIMILSGAINTDANGTPLAS